MENKTILKRKDGKEITIERTPLAGTLVARYEGFTCHLWESEEELITWSETIDLQLLPKIIVCNTCESKNVFYDAWVAVNDEEDVRTFDDIFCEECDGPTDVKEI